MVVDTLSMFCRLESCTHALFRRRWKALEETSTTVPDLLRFGLGLTLRIHDGGLTT